MMAIVQLTVILFVFWVLLSGSVELPGLITGLLLSLLVALLSRRILWGEGDEPFLSGKQMVRFFVYVGYLVKEIVSANIHVAELVLDPRLPIDPMVVEHATPLQRPVSRVALANSITLTPGTLTIDVDESTFWVHCIARRFSEDIASHNLDRKIGRVFEED